MKIREGGLEDASDFCEKREINTSKFVEEACQKLDDFIQNRTYLHI